MSALALISELMMQSQVSAGARRAGVELAVVASEDALVKAAEQSPPRLVVVDLAHPGIDPRQLYERLSPQLTPETHSLAFGPHVHRQRLADARDSGFSQVLSRGQVHAEMDALLARYGSEPN